ncbi:MAG: potassium transporter TrkA [Salinigranum sp.]
MIAAVAGAAAPPDPLSLQGAARIVGFAVASFAVAAGAALLYRWYTREIVPAGLALLLGLSVVSLYLSTVHLFGQLLAGTAPSNPFALERVLYNLVVLGVAAAVSPAGRLAGDRLATDVFAFVGVRELDAEVSRIVRTVGRVSSVTLPEEIADMEGYDPIDPATKAAMAGKTLLFPRRLTTAELRDRLVARLKDDYGVGHVDVDLGDDGSVAYLAVGSRAAGLGPTLAPGTVAVAVRADPPADAGPGDRIQIWGSPPPVGPSADAERVATGELRGVAGDVVTVALDEADARRLTDEATYRLVTLPGDPQADREFTSLLRAAEETLGAVTVAEGGALDGATVGSLEVTVVAARPAGGTVVPIPSRSRTLAPGDAVYAVARPEALRRLESRSRRAPAGDVGREP